MHFVFCSFIDPLSTLASAAISSNSAISSTNGIKQEPDAANAIKIEPGTEIKQVITY